MFLSHSCPFARMLTPEGKHHGLRCGTMNNLWICCNTCCSITQEQITGIKKLALSYSRLEILMFYREVIVEGFKYSVFHEHLCFISTQPPYSLRVDECSEYICVNGQLLLHNSSQHCRYNISQPQCNLLGTPIQTNTDPCCPLWQCPCKKYTRSDGYFYVSVNLLLSLLYCSKVWAQ